MFNAPEVQITGGNFYDVAGDVNFQHIRVRWESDLPDAALAADGPVQQLEGAESNVGPGAVSLPGYAAISS